MSGGFLSGIGNYVECTVQSSMAKDRPCRIDWAFRRLCFAPSRASWACTTGRSPGNDGLEAVLCRAQVSVSRGPYMGLGATPARWRISRSPCCVRFIALADRIRYETGRGTCAPGAPASPAGAVPPSAEPRHLVVYRIRSGPVLAGDSFQYQGCRASTFPSRACPDTSSLMSSTQLRRACLPVRVVCAAARREARQAELPRDFCPTLPPWRAFCSPVWFGELRRFTKSEANITTILTANLPFMFTHRGFPLSILSGSPLAGLGRRSRQSRN
jgi:hypothetical protein